MSMGAMLLLLISSFGFLVSSGVVGKETLRVGILISQGDDSQDGRIDHSGYLPTLYYALETVNRDPSLQYRFAVLLKNSEVS